jgi:hypothetical protein
MRRSSAVPHLLAKRASLIHIAVVVEVAKGKAVTAVAGNDTGTGLRIHFREGAIAPIAKRTLGMRIAYLGETRSNSG